MDKKILCALILVAFLFGALTSYAYFLPYTLNNNPAIEKTQSNHEDSTTKIIYDRLFELDRNARIIVNVSGSGKLIYFTYSTNNPLTNLIFFIDGKRGFDFQVEWEYKVAERRNDTPLAQILRYDTENNVFVVEIFIPLEFHENFTIKAYVHGDSEINYSLEAEILIWELLLVLKEG